MDTEDHAKDSNAILQSLLTTENPKSLGFNTLTGTVPSMPNVHIVHVYNDGSTVHCQSDGPELQQPVDLESLPWQNLSRNEYSVGDALLWDGTVQVDQLYNLHSLDVLESTAGGELKKTELYSNVPVSPSHTLQNSVLSLENISTLNSTSPTPSANVPCIPNSSQLSTINPSSPAVQLPSLGPQTFPAALQKSPRTKRKKQALKSGSNPGGKKPKKLKTSPQAKGLVVKSLSSAERSTFSTSASSSRNTRSRKGVKKKVTQDHLNPSALEYTASQVQDRFNLGCECQDSNCFDGLCSENVFRHRLNIAELTKDEHDMYLMGVTMASLGNTEHTIRNKERQRLRANYVYQGRHVCLQAFLYLENCTLYQVKRIRKHVMTNGVVPRIHGNHGKKPHNRFPLELYCHTTDFLKNYLRRYNVDRDVSKTTPLIVGPDVTRKSVHQAYLNFCETHKPDEKVMGYSTFRHFMKEQFPYIRFRHLDPGIGRDSTKQHSQQQLKQHEQQTSSEHPPQRNSQLQKKAQSHPRAQLPNRKEEPQTRPKACQSAQAQNVKMIALTDAPAEGEDRTHVNVTQNSQPNVGDGNVVLLNTAVPLMAGSNFVMLASQLSKDGNPRSPGGNVKTMTINSGSLRLVSANGVSASSLVPMNTLAMLGPGVFPIYLDTEPVEQVELPGKRKNERIVIESSGDQESPVRTSRKAS